MWDLKKGVLFASLPLTVACDQSVTANKSMGTKQTYSLCPKTEDSRQMLYEQVKDFANQQHARLIDRGAGAQRELSAMKSDVLQKTGGEPVLLTVEKPGEFRITVSNLGLKEKFGLAVRILGEPRKYHAVDRFVHDLGRFWTIQGVDGSVTNDPPC